ncbi:MAG: uracil-DNA glycosylase, partial [Calditrichia bacterium]
MSREDNSFRKLADFFASYRDVYGDDIFVDERRMKELMEKLPDFKLAAPAPPAPPEQKTTPVSKSGPGKPDTPLWNYMREINNCQKCPLWKTRTNFVFGDGNEPADIMFIGEAPGAEEDRTGIPFVGRAGQLLNKLLAHIRLKREDVFIANILKSRPPNNRDPQPEEVAACIPYLHRQIELIEPRLIVALGRIAAQNLLQTNSSLKQ